MTMYRRIELFGWVYEFDRKAGTRRLYNDHD